MNIDTIRTTIKGYLNKQCYFTYYGSRGQEEKFIGKINNIYSRIFTIKTIDGTTKSFSYSDLAINNIKIKYNN